MSQEHGYNHMTSAYKENPEESWEQIVAHVIELYPKASEKQIRKVFG